MENYINLQNVLVDPKKSFIDFKQQLQSSDISSFTYLGLLLTTAASIKRNGFNFELYLDLLIHFKNEEGFAYSCINYSGYKDDISILMNACQKSQLLTVKALIKHPLIQLKKVDPNGLNAIFYAIRNTDENQGLKIFQVLYEAYPDLINIGTYCTPLFYAVEKFRTKIVEFILRSGVDPNQKTLSNGNTAMHQLVKISSKYYLEDVKKMIEIFLRHGFDLSDRNFQGATVEQYAFNLRFNISEVIKQILCKVNGSEFGQSQEGQTDLSSKKQRTTAKCDVFTCENESDLLESDQNIDDLSISDKSLFSQIHYINRDHEQLEKQFSVCMNVKPQKSQQYIEQNLSHSQKQQLKLECRSHSGSFNSNCSSNQKSNKSQYSYIMSSSSSEQEDLQNQFNPQQKIDFMKLQMEIIEFDQISWKIYISAWQEIQIFFNKLSEIIEPLGLHIQLIGSFATGLWTYHSDIDIALVTNNQVYVDFQKLLQKVYGKIRSKIFDLGVKKLCFNKASKIQNIKIQMDSILYGGRKIDIMIFHRKNTAQMYVSYISQALFAYKQIRPLFFTLKRICQQFGLHDPYKGGLKSYSIFLMIYSLITTLQYNNLGQFFEKLSLYYGFYHQYEYNFELNLNQKGIQEVKGSMILNIKDPINTKNNMGGKNTNADRVRSMFRAIYYGIHKNMKEDKTTLQHILEMAHII